MANLISIEDFAVKHLGRTTDDKDIKRTKKMVWRLGDLGVKVPGLRNVQVNVDRWEQIKDKAVKAKR